MTKKSNKFSLTSGTGIFISGVLIFIYWNQLIDPTQMWKAIWKILVTMYWFSVAFFFRLGARQVAYAYTYALVRSASFVFLGYILGKVKSASLVFLGNFLAQYDLTLLSQTAYVIGFWTFFYVMTSAMMKKAYADYIYYRFSKIIYTIIPAVGNQFLQKTYNIIMDNIALDSTANWRYYEWIYYRHKEAKNNSNHSKFLCATTREFPHEGWVVFYFEYILKDEVYETNLSQILIMQPYTSLLSMEGTQRVGLAVKKYLSSYRKKDDLYKVLTHIKDEINADTLNIVLK